MQRTTWPQTAPKNIIVRMPNWLGDAVMAAPLLSDLRAHFPKTKITAMCQGIIGQLFTHDPHINEVFAFQKPSGWIHRKQHIALYTLLARGEYDLGILTPNSFSSAWWFYRGNVRNRIGFQSHWRSPLLTKALPFPENKDEIHLVETYKHLLAPLGIPISETPPTLFLSPTELNDARRRLAKYGIEVGENVLVGINPGAAYGTAKCWLPERFREVTKKLIENPRVYVLYFGDPSTAPVVNQICQGMPERVINLAGRTSIRELMALIQTCSIFLTNDSGPMHIADALQTPLLALFGSTSDVKTGPYHHGKVIHKHVSCSPCYQRVCPIDFRCMTRIGADEVYAQLAEMIEKINHAVAAP